MNNATKALSINADATYKLIWQGFPVLVLGTTDMEKKFHFIGIAVCKSETEDDFAFAFNAIKNSVLKIFEIELQPKALISDAAKAIQNAFVGVFGHEVTGDVLVSHAQKRD